MNASTRLGNLPLMQRILLRLPGQVSFHECSVRISERLRSNGSLIDYEPVEKDGVNAAHIKKAVPRKERLFELRSWRCPTLTWGDPTLPSALNVFTSEFGMGSGGSRSLLPPGKLVGASSQRSSMFNHNSEKVLMQVSHTYVAPKNTLVLYGQASRAISTG